MIELQGERLVGQLEPGEDLLVIGPIGQTGTKILAEAGRDRLRQWFSESYLREISEHQERDIREILPSLFPCGLTEMLPVEEGGIFKAIWDLSARHRAGAAFHLLRIPILQGTVELCQRWECNPYRLYCGNCAVAAAYHGNQVVERCSQAGVAAAVIGQIQPGIARKILHGEDTGYLERPREDELYRILGRDAALRWMNQGK